MSLVLRSELTGPQHPQLQRLLEPPGKLASGGKVTIDVDDADKVVLRFEEEPAVVA